MNSSLPRGWVRDRDVDPALDAQVLTVARASWRALLIVPTEPGSSALGLAEALVEQCNSSTALPATLFSLELLGKAEVAGVVSGVLSCTRQNGRAVIAIEAPTGSSSGTAGIQVADAALLCVELGVTTTENARRAIALVGRELFLGAVTLQRRHRRGT